ncbi:MAG: TlpA disulfide reductase family protein [Flavipsychrobacter sp.]|nr:TlpA disulfide reductase family protein [Flavipsychrobacter sp.]
MKKLLFFTSILFSFCLTNAQSIKSYTADQLMLRASAKDTVYIINFWATWCAPCCAELPQFDALQALYTGKPVKIIMASFDFKESYPDKIAAFVEKRKLKPEVVWFNETNANTFIPKIDSSWLGSIPSTLILNRTTGFRQFIEGTITSGQIGEIVNKQLALK